MEGPSDLHGIADQSGAGARAGLSQHTQGQRRLRPRSEEPMIKHLLLVAATLSAGVTAATAAEIKVISANGMREVINDSKAKFEASSGHKLAVTVVETGAIRQRVLA